MKTLYGGIDLHATNSVIVLLDEEDRVLVQKRVCNELDQILAVLAPHREGLEPGLVVESTYNWYWLVDGLMEAILRDANLRPIHLPKLLP